MRFRIFLLRLSHLTAVFNDNFRLRRIPIDHRIHRLRKQILRNFNALAKFCDCLIRKVFSLQLHVITRCRNIRTPVCDAINIICHKQKSCGLLRLLLREHSTRKQLGNVYGNTLLKFFYSLVRIFILLSRITSAHAADAVFQCTYHHFAVICQTFHFLRHKIHRRQRFADHFVVEILRCLVHYYCLILSANDCGDNFHHNRDKWQPNNRTKYIECGMRIGNLS